MLQHTENEKEEMHCGKTWISSQLCALHVKVQGLVEDYKKSASPLFDV